MENKIYNIRSTGDFSLPGCEWKTKYTTLDQLVTLTYQDVNGKQNNTTLDQLVTSTYHDVNGKQNIPHKISW
jgi:hypothetical protein